MRPTGYTLYLFLFYLYFLKVITRTRTWIGKARVAKHHQPGQDTGRTARHRIWGEAHPGGRHRGSQKVKGKESLQQSQTRPDGHTLRKIMHRAEDTQTGDTRQLVNDPEGNREEPLARSGAETSTGRDPHKD